MIIYNSKIIKYLFFKNVVAATIGPFILVRDKSASKRTIKHERIHVVQWVELSIVGAIAIAILSFIFNFSLLYVLLSIFLFYIWYIVEYLIKLPFNGFDNSLAYRSISFEREAYGSEVYYNLPVRKVFNFKFLKFLI